MGAVRNSGGGGEGCLICNQLIKTGEVFPPSTSRSPQLLANDLNVYFILKHVLQIPSEQLESFLRHSPHSPGGWVKICGNCEENYVDKCKRIFGELMEVKRRFNAARRQLIEVVKRSCEEESKGGGEDDVNEPFILDIWKETRKFVAKNGYGQYYSVVDPFITGDFMANEKLATIQKSGETIEEFCALYHQINRSNCKNYPQTTYNQGENLHAPSETEPIIGDDGRKSDVKQEPIWMCSNEEIDHTGFYDDCREEGGDDDSEDTRLPISNFSYAKQQDMPEDEQERKLPKSPPSAVVKRKRGRPKKNIGPTKKKVLQCAHCQKKFISKSSYLNHLGSSHGIKDQLKFTCTFEECGKSFFKKSQLLDHEDMHNNRQYECQVCGLAFQRKGSLHKHLETHKTQEEQPFQCHLCPARYSRNYNLKSHIKNVHVKGVVSRGQKGVEVALNKRTKRTKGWHARTHVKCSECGLTFGVRTKLQVHMDKMHGPSANPPKPLLDTVVEQLPQPKVEKPVKPKVELKCDQCPDKIFNTERKLRQHQIKIHKTNFYTCAKCGWTTSNNCYLPDHMKRYHGDEQDLKDLTCPICQKVFSYQKKLQEHITHYHKNPVEKFVCEHCGRELADKIGYLNHLGTAHGVKDGLRFTCSFAGCGRAFYKKSQLLYHEGAHTPGHQCHICGKKLSRDFQLKRHLKLHELRVLNLKPFECELCPAKFSMRDNLLGHSRRVHKVNLLDANVGSGMEMT